MASSQIKRVLIARPGLDGHDRRAKFINHIFKEKINPLIGAAGVSAVPDSARVVQLVGQQKDPNNFLPCMPWPLM